MSATGTVMVDTAGRVVIPAKVRQEMGIESGAELVMALENGVLTLVSKKSARLAARQAVQRLVPAGVSLSEQLLEDRRQDGD
ncbi:MAG: AbrB/MazE/SpoVT family DNA-binding domain-containing protein [Bryobacteraceae bacterium]|nr:AbrB/MazE/SpoVT family DNA-binding domain-containing protein [Bryobacteraceae bacterium]